jgi:phosphatidylglycerophosphate synthase
MNLHRSDGKSDWEKLAPAKRNAWQQVAASTNGVVTAANALTVIGLMLVLTGLVLIGAKEYWAGVIIVAAGRLCDVLDGIVAEATGTKSRLGESLDASFDKLALLAVFVVLPIVGIMPWWMVAILLVPNLLNSILATIAVRRAIVLHPSRAGKLSMAYSSAAILIIVLLQVVSSPIETALKIILAVALLLAFVIGLQSSRDYLKEMRAAKSANP